MRKILNVVDELATATSARHRMVLGYYLVECPRCHADVDQLCVAPSTTKDRSCPHAERKHHAARFRFLVRELFP